MEKHSFKTYSVTVEALEAPPLIIRFSPNKLTIWSQVERQALEYALARTSNSQSGAAKLLGWNRNTVAKLMREYGIKSNPMGKTSHAKV